MRKYGFLYFIEIIFGVKLNLNVSKIKKLWEDI